MDISNLKSSVDNQSIDANKAQANKKEQSLAAENKKSEQAQSSSAVQMHLNSYSTQQMNLTILHRSLAVNLEGISDKPLAKFEVPKAINIDEATKDNESLFDFEEVAKNVLSFVEGALTSASQSGASQDELNEMLAQARKGVEMGVGAARKDLGLDKNSDDPLAIGINKAHERINFGLDEFEKSINGENADRLFSAQSYQSNFSQENNGSINLKTAEGDTVQISFASLKAYQEKLNQLDVKQQNEAGDHFTVKQTEYSQAFFQSESFSFSVDGDLNEDELVAIGELVNDAANLASKFYDGNVQAAYQQAQKLGFDEAQISTFSLNLSQQTQAAQSYTAVAGYEKQSQQMPETVKQPLNDYVQDLMKMVDKNKQNLADQGEVENMMTQVFSQQHQLSGNELIDVVNRFNHFNQKLLGE